MTHKTKADIFMWVALLMLVGPALFVIGWKIVDVYEKDPGLVVFGAICLGWFAIIGFCMSQSDYHRKKTWS